jgi:hypothetical protein
VFVALVIFAAIVGMGKLFKPPEEQGAPPPGQPDTRITTD